jgi:hypothetical protein
MSTSESPRRSPRYRHHRLPEGERNPDAAAPSVPRIDDPGLKTDALLISVDDVVYVRDALSDYAELLATTKRGLAAAHVSPEEAAGAVSALERHVRELYVHVSSLYRG